MFLFHLPVHSCNQCIRIELVMTVDIKLLISFGGKTRASTILLHEKGIMLTTRKSLSHNQYNSHHHHSFLLDEGVRRMMYREWCKTIYIIRNCANMSEINVASVTLHYHKDLCSLVWSNSCFFGICFADPPSWTSHPKSQQCQGHACAW